MKSKICVFLFSQRILLIKISLAKYNTKFIITSFEVEFRESVMCKIYLN